MHRTDLTVSAVVEHEGRFLIVEDYLAGKRKPDSFLANLMPLQQNVAAVMANAALV